MKKITILLFLLSVSLSAFSQTEKLNAYKYIIVADKFEFVKTVDQYQTSSLTKFLLKKNGFDVFLSNEDLPKDLDTAEEALSAFVNGELSRESAIKILMLTEGDTREEATQEVDNLRIGATASDSDL